MIIMYHRIKNNRVSCNLKEFKRQLLMAKKYNWELTFDDGLKEHYTIAFPLLKKLGLRASFFSITGKIKNGLNGKRWEGQEFMTMDELREMHESGMIIGNHSHSHLRLGELTKEQQEEEIRISTDILTKEISKPFSFSYPFGNYNKDTLEILKKYGYKFAVTTRPEQESLELRRTDTNAIKELD